MELLFLNLGGVEILMLMLIGVLPFVLTIYCLVDIMRSKFKDPINKFLWTIIVIFVPIMGPILYFVIGKGQKAIEGI